MIVCSCNIISDKEIAAYLAAQKGDRPSYGQIYNACSKGCPKPCSRCMPLLRDVIDKHYQLHS